MLDSESSFSQLNPTSFLLLRNWFKSGIFLIGLILASIPLMMFALLAWKLEKKTVEEEQKFSRSKEPDFTNNLSVYQRGLDSINATARSAGTGRRK